MAEADTDLAACRAQLAHGSRTFLAASLLLPRAVREPACALYAFCRQADDEVDGQSGGQSSSLTVGQSLGQSLGQSGDSSVRQAGGRARGPGLAPGGHDAAAAAAAVARLRLRLAAVYAGQPAARPADRALAAVVRRFDIPAALPEALIEGFAWDAEGRRYDSLADLQAYAARVAGTVGAMMALLMGQRSAPALARACDLGVAMQLSNIARDVGEDARAGRLYLPRQWLADEGLDADAWLAAPAHSPALGRVLARLLAEADALYARVDAGVAVLPLACRPGINAARFLYAEIGHQVARNGLNAVATRARVGRPRKLASLLHALVALAPADTAATLPPLPANRALVEAVCGPLTPATLATPPHRLARVLASFDRLQRGDGRPAPRSARGLLADG